MSDNSTSSKKFVTDSREVSITLGIRHQRLIEIISKIDNGDDFINTTLSNVRSRLFQGVLITENGVKLIQKAL